MDQFETSLDERRKELEAMAAFHETLRPRIEELMANDPLLPASTAFTIAMDEHGIHRARKAIDDGQPALYAVHLVGSYARFAAAVELLPRKQLSEHITDLWSYSDPDDTNPEFLRVWWEAHEDWRGAPKGKSYKTSYIRDDKTLPGRGRTLTLYRGQDPGPPSGISWSTDLEVARRFATGAATRQRDRPGVVLQGVASREAVLGFMSLRGENEVIVSPADIMFYRTREAYERVPREQ